MKKIVFLIFFNTFFIAYTQPSSIEEKINVREELTEEKLLEIIKIAENSPDPENTVNIDENIEEKQFLKVNESNRERLHLDSDYSLFVKKYYDFLDELNNEIKDYEFQDKTKVVPIKNEISKEITSEKIIEDFEIGLGIKYQGQKEGELPFDQEQSGIGYRKSSMLDENNFGNVPIYATGKYNFTITESGAQPYLKLNLGYYIEGIENRNRQTSNSEYHPLNTTMEYENGRYYGIGGGIEYNNGLTFDVMYQINKNKKNEERGEKDDRITFSVEYKLDL